MTHPPIPVQVFAAASAGAWGRVQELRGCPQLRLVSSPRHASVLLIAGTIPAAHAEALRHVHDQLPHPRTSVAWAGDVVHAAQRTVPPGDACDMVATIVDAHRRLTDDPAASYRDLLPDVDPNPWRGVGPHGQGGEGMMGGTPYGRPMAMTADDRDGLALDQVHVRVGPFFDALPGGLVLDVTLQGDLIQGVDVERGEGCPGATGDAGVAAGAADEVSEARRGLRWLAHALHVHGLDAHASRAARLAVQADPEAGAGRTFRSLRRALARTGLSWTLRGVGRLDGMGDAAGRWRAHLDRIEAGLSTPQSRLDPSPAAPVGELDGQLAGMTWSDAVTTILSLGPAHVATDHVGP